MGTRTRHLQRSEQTRGLFFFFSVEQSRMNCRVLKTNGSDAKHQEVNDVRQLISAKVYIAALTDDARPCHV